MLIYAPFDGSGPARNRFSVSPSANWLSRYHHYHANQYRHHHARRDDYHHYEVNDAFKQRINVWVAVGEYEQVKAVTLLFAAAILAAIETVEKDAIALW